MSNNSDSKPKKKERKLTEAEIKRKANFKRIEALPGIFKTIVFQKYLIIGIESIK